MEFVLLYLLVISGVAVAIAGPAELPRWTRIPLKFQQCPTDSPQIYYERVYQHELNELLKESSGFFASLLEALETSVPDDLNATSEEVWLNTSHSILVGQEFHAHNIRGLWSLIIERWDGGQLPWERDLKVPLVMEVLTAIGAEHLGILRLYQNGIQAILKPLQNHVGNVLKLLKAELGASGDLNPASMQRKIEKILEELEPSFIGKFLLALVKKNTTGPSFVGKVLEEAAIILESFRAHHARPLFWGEMADVLVKPVVTDEQLIAKYISSHSNVIQSLLQILQESFQTFG